jgi:CelD/BcsL family acetyltransferase involved in cellulose biosynthesis
MNRAEGATVMLATARAQREAANLRRLPALQVEVYQGSDLDVAAWPSIARRPDLAMNVFQAREFLEPWIRTIGPARRARPYLAIVRDRDRSAVLYLPLAVETHLNVALLRFPDAGMSDMNGPIVAGNRSLTASEFAAVWREMLGSLPPIDAVDLQKMPATINGRHNPLTYLSCDADATCGFTIELAALRNEVYRRPSIVRARRKLERQFRRLAEQGSTEFIVNPSGQQLEAVVETLFSLKRDQFLRTYGRDLFTMPGVEQFYRHMTSPGSLGRTSHLSALLCGGLVVSAHLGFIGRGRFYYVMPAYDIRFRSLAPGHLLLDHLINRSVEDGFNVFDLGEGDFAYKRKWATHTTALSRHEAPVTMRGRLYLEARRWHRRFVAHGGGRQGHPEQGA